MTGYLVSYVVGLREEIDSCKIIEVTKDIYNGALRNVGTIRDDISAFPTTVG